MEALFVHSCSLPKQEWRFDGFSKAKKRTCATHAWCRFPQFDGKIALDCVVFQCKKSLTDER